jgi:hypothetical protein
VELFANTDDTIDDRDAWIPEVTPTTTRMYKSKKRVK